MKGTSSTGPGAVYSALVALLATGGLFAPELDSDRRSDATRALERR